MLRLSLDSPFGGLALEAEGKHVTALHWGGRAVGRPSSLLLEAKQQLLGYLARQRHSFALPLAPKGSSVEQRVWRAMAEIPYGGTRSYGDLAKALDLSPRVVGAACGRNPLPILLPCHRVIGSDGGLGGYSGGEGVETKRRLLQLEGALLL